MIDDLVLVRRFTNGDVTAFDELYRRHNRRAYYLCLRIIGDPAEAEDALQESFLQLYKKCKSFRAESEFATWFYRLVTNAALMCLRKKKSRRFEISIDEVVVGDEDDVPRQIVVIDSHVMLSVERLEFERVLNALPPGYRTIFCLHDIEGYEHNEIADILGVSIGNSKSQLHKARERLIFALNPLGILSDFEKFLAVSKEE